MVGAFHLLNDIAQGVFIAATLSGLTADFMFCHALALYLRCGKAFLGPSSGLHHVTEPLLVWHTELTEAHCCAPIVVDVWGRNDPNQTRNEPRVFHELHDADRPHRLCNFLKLIDTVGGCTSCIFGIRPLRGEGEPLRESPLYCRKVILWKKTSEPWWHCAQHSLWIQYSQWTLSWWSICPEL